MKVSFVALALLAPACLVAQAEKVTVAVESITEADVRRRVSMLADDSMGGRDTPSPGLEKAAEWIASEFKRFGLKPAGDNGGFIQRFPVTLIGPSPDSTYLEITDGKSKAKFQLGKNLTVFRGLPPNPLTAADLVLAGGNIKSLPAGQLKGKVVLWMADWTKGRPSYRNEVAEALRAAGAMGVVLVVNSDSIMAVYRAQPLPSFPILGKPDPAQLASMKRAGAPERAYFLAAIPAAELWAGVASLEKEHRKLAASEAPTVKPLSGSWKANTLGAIEQKEVKAPNVVGIVEGTDPTLKNEYLIFSAHMDHVGSGCGGTSAKDMICNGADDDASGTTGVLELAEAFAMAPPKRSIIFLTVSGEEKGLWGSEYFASNMPIKTESAVANFNIDMIGRNWKDTIVAIGMEHSDLGATANEISAKHPELRMKIIDDLWPDENFYRRSDHFNFAVKGIPILFFFNGVHEDYHMASDTPDKIDADKEARLLKLLFYIGHEVGNRADRPKWNPKSYDEIVKKQK